LKFDILKSREDIIHAIKVGKKKPKSILWQSAFGTKVVFEFTGLDLDNKRDLIRIKVSENYKLRSNLPVYIKLNHRNTIFKGYIHFIEKDLVFFKLPDEIHIEEYREFERFSISEDESSEIFLNVESNLVSNAKVKIPIILNDISQSGLGAVIREKDKSSLLERDSTITLSELGDVKFAESISLKIVHAVQMATENKGHMAGVYKIGIKFDETLSKDYLQQFLKEEERVYLHQYDYLKFGTSFKKKLRQEMTSLLNEVLLKPDFFETFALFITESKKEDYIPQHVRSVGIASCAIAKLLGMNDRLTLEQLIYCAYTHDLAFFKVPKLAKIQNREEFEKVKDHLTLAEKQLYFKAHSFAYENSVNDKHAPYGADFILEDLSKFNKHVNPEKYIQERNISYPLAIFMVAHELIEFANSKRHWTFHNFVQTSSLRNYGGAYDEIFTNIDSLKKSA
jgi:HD-GYP domain-containing protein (c-di-GMP phosphodiesterase class II)